MIILKMMIKYNFSVDIPCTGVSDVERLLYNHGYTEDRPWTKVPSTEWNDFEAEKERIILILNKYLPDDINQYVIKQYIYI